MIRRTNPNLEDLYEANGQYRYWNNFNPAALIVYFGSAAVGILVPDFSFFVALVISFIAFYALMKVWILPRYPQSEVEDHNVRLGSTPKVEKKIQRDSTTVTDFGARLEPALRVEPGERFLVET